MLSKISASVSGELASAATSATAATDSSKVKVASDLSCELNILSNLPTGFAPLVFSFAIHSKFMTSKDSSLGYIDLTDRKSGRI